MPKRLLRIVAVLLVPCLLADPSRAYVLAGASASSKTNSSLLISQALSVTSMGFPKRLGKLDTTVRATALLMLLLAGAQNTVADDTSDAKPNTPPARHSMIDRLVKVFTTPETAPASEQPAEALMEVRKPIDFSLHSPLAPKVRPMVLPEQPRIPFQQQAAPKQLASFLGRAPDAPEQPAHISIERPIKKFKLYPYQNLIIPNAHRYGLDALLVRILLQKESKGDPDAESDAGAIGLMQIEPDTAMEIAEELGLIHEGETIEDVLRDPVRNIRIGTRYLCILSKRYNGALDLVLAAYNAGMGKVDAWIALTGKLGWIPIRETRNYVSSITEKYQAAGGDITRPVSTVLPNGDPINRTASLILPLLIGAITILHHFLPTDTHSAVQMASFGLGSGWMTGALLIFIFGMILDPKDQWTKDLPIYPSNLSTAFLYYTYFLPEERGARLDVEQGEEDIFVDGRFTPENLRYAIAEIMNNAFDETSVGRIRVSLRKTPDGAGELKVTNKGAVAYNTLRAKAELGVQEKRLYRSASGWHLVKVPRELNPGETLVTRVELHQLPDSELIFISLLSRGKTNRSTGYLSEGLGLGMAETRSLARAAGGDLTVSSHMENEEAYTTFTLTIPGQKGPIHPNKMLSGAA